MILAGYACRWLRWDWVIYIGKMRSAVETAHVARPLLAGAKMCGYSERRRVRSVSIDPAPTWADRAAGRQRRGSQLPLQRDAIVAGAEWLTSAATLIRPHAMKPPPPPPPQTACLHTSSVTLFRSTVPYSMNCAWNQIGEKQWKKTKKKTACRPYEQYFQCRR